MTENELSYKIIGAAIEVHKTWELVYWNMHMKLLWLMN